MRVGRSTQCCRSRNLLPPPTKLLLETIRLRWTRCWSGTVAQVIFVVLSAVPSPNLTSCHPHSFPRFSRLYRLSTGLSCVFGSSKWSAAACSLQFLLLRPSILCIQRCFYEQGLRLLRFLALLNVVRRELNSWFRIWCAAELSWERKHGCPVCVLLRALCRTPLTRVRAWFRKSCGSDQFRGKATLPVVVLVLYNPEGGCLETQRLASCKSGSH